MEKITVYFRNGKFTEFADYTTSMISGNHLIITTKSSDTNDDGPVAIAKTTIIDLSSVDNFVKITPTRKFDLEENVSTK